MNLGEFIKKLDDLDPNILNRVYGWLSTSAMLYVLAVYYEFDIRQYEGVPKSQVMDLLFTHIANRVNV